MSDRQLADAAWLELTKSTDSYPTWKRKGFPASSHWAKAKAFLDQIDIAPPPVFVSPTGNNLSGDGSQLKPYKTLAWAQSAMRSGGPKTCYVRGGNYAVPPLAADGLTYGLHLTAADNGQTYSYFPDDGYNTAVLDGGSKDATTGIHELITIDGASDVTIDGLTLQHFRWIGVGIHGGPSYTQMLPNHPGAAARNTVRNNIIRQGSYDTAPGYGYGGAAIYGRGEIPGTTIEHNGVHDFPGGGINIAAGDWILAPHYLDGLGIHGNAVTKTCQKVTDAGAIYVQDISASALGIGIFDNFVRDAMVGRAIYLDDGTSNADVLRNVLAGHFDIAYTVHGGRMVKIRGGLIDSAAGATILRFQDSSVATDHAGVEFTNHIVVGKDYMHYSLDFAALVKNNLYHPYIGTIDTAPDTAPVFADPLLRDPLYTLDPASPALKAPVSFPPLVREWGPPGYVIPAGTAASYA